MAGYHPLFCDYFVRLSSRFVGFSVNAVFALNLIVAILATMKLPAQPNQSLIDGLAVLQDIAARQKAVGSRELARELDIEPTRVNRLLKTLAHLGLAEQDADRKYSAGPGIHVLAAQSLFGSGMIRRAVPHLEKLHRHGLIVAMGVLWRDKVSYLYHAEPGMSASQALGRVSLFPANRSAIGLALLAERQDLRKCDRPLQAQIRQIRQQGFGQVHPEQKQGKKTGNITSLGVALPKNSTVAIALSGNIKQKQIPALVEILKKTAEQIRDDSGNI